MPVPMRAMNSQKAFWTVPVRATSTPQIDIEAAAMSLRGWRSARVLSGIDPSRNRTPNAPPMAPITASLTPRLDWMSGARMASAVLSNPSMSRVAPTATTVEAPPTRSASRRPIESAPTPGRRSSGNTVSVRA
jgi:hypothetical protein